ncbi:MAG: sigma-E factor negative regulatory protein [Burkholderiaceae bacterium]
MTGTDGWAPAAKQRLSALVDGEADDAALRLACAQWRDTPEAVTTWRDYHLIGDALRSDDLATPADHDARFLDTLRVRLALEPTVLAPAAIDADRRSVEERQAAALAAPRRSWRAASVVAAGFMAVAGVLVVLRDTGTPVTGPDLAQAGPATSNVMAASAGGSRATTLAVSEDPGLEIASGSLIRDARLDQYLKAHQQFSGSSALGATSTFMRNATVEAPRR